MPRSPIRAALGLALALFLARPATADLINFTGNVANDFPAGANATSSYTIPGQPGSVAESSYIIKNGWTTGFLIESVKFTYDKATDTLYVGVQTYSIAGDADGNGNPGRTSTQMAEAGGTNFAHFGGDKSLTIAFANASATGTGPGTTAFIAGIPADKTEGDARNTNDFTVATYRNDSRGLAYSYGSILNNHVGALADDPSASKPNFEFALTNVSKIPGFNLNGGFYVDIYLGSQRAITVGKESINWTKVPDLNPAPGNLSNPSGPIDVPSSGSHFGNSPPPIKPSSVPEPSAALLLGIGGLACLASACRKFLPAASAVRTPESTT